jgi:hypothetical protein
MVVTQDVVRGSVRVRLHHEPASARALEAEVTLIQTGSDGEMLIEGVPMRAVSGDVLEAELPLVSDRPAVATVQLGDGRSLSLAPVCLPYSSELVPTGSGLGETEIERLIEVGGGRVVLRPETVWNAIPKAPRSVEVAPILYLLAVLLLLGEVLERRSGLVAVALSRWRRWSWSWVRSWISAPFTGRGRTGADSLSEGLTDGATGEKGADGNEPPGGLVDAIAEVGRRSKRRV